MPIFTFKCPNCGKFSDKFVRDREAKTAPCGYCGGEAEKTVSPVAPFVWGRSGGWN